MLLANLGSKKTTKRENLFLAFLAPRGIVAAAVASIFALEFSHAAHEHAVSEKIAQQAEQLVPVTFIVIIGCCVNMCSLDLDDSARCTDTASADSPAATLGAPATRMPADKAKPTAALFFCRAAMLSATMLLRTGRAFVILLLVLSISDGES